MKRLITNRGISKSQLKARLKRIARELSQVSRQNMIIYASMSMYAMANYLQDGALDASLGFLR